MGLAPTWMRCRSPRPTASSTPRGTPAGCTPAATTATPRAVLAAARYLAETAPFDGTVNLIFQPAEERRRRRAEDDHTACSTVPLPTRCSACTTGEHQAGQFRHHAGPMMASGNRFEITVNRQGRARGDCRTSASTRCSSPCRSCRACRALVTRTRSRSTRRCCRSPSSRPATRSTSCPIPPSSAAGVRTSIRGPGISSRADAAHRAAHRRGARRHAHVTFDRLYYPATINRPGAGRVRREGGR